MVPQTASQIAARPACEPAVVLAVKVQNRGAERIQGAVDCFPSGVTAIELGDLLSGEKGSPEHQALVRLIGTLVESGKE
jgi:hypothetical protein